MRPGSINTIKNMIVFLSFRTSGATWWQKAQQILRRLTMSPWWRWTVYWNVPLATTATVSSEHASTLAFPAISYYCCTSVSWKCPVSRSTSEYVSAIVELSDLIIDRRQKILHHWDWVYWKTQQGKRFKKALSIVHRYLLTFMQQGNTSDTGNVKSDDTLSLQNGENQAVVTSLMQSYLCYILLC